MPNRFKKAAEAGDAYGGEEAAARPKSSLKGDLRHLTTSMKNVFRRASSSQSHDSHRSDASDCGSLSSAGDGASLASEADPPPSMTGAAALLSVFASDGGGDEDAIKAKLRELEAARAEARRVGGVEDAMGASSTMAMTTAAVASTASSTGAGSPSTSASISSSSNGSGTGVAAAAAAECRGGVAVATVSAAEAASVPGAAAAPADGRPPLPKRKGSGLAPLDDVEKAGDAVGSAERLSSFSSGLVAGGASLATTLASLIGASPRHRSASAPNTSTAATASALVSGWGSKAGGGASGTGTPAGLGQERAGSGLAVEVEVDVGDGVDVDLGGAEEAGEGYNGMETLSRNHPMFEMLRQRSQLSHSRSSSSNASEALALAAAATDLLAKAELAAVAGAAEAAKTPAPPRDQPPAQAPPAPSPGLDVPPTPSSSLVTASLGAPPQPSPVAAGVAATSTAQGQGPGQEQGQNGTGAAAVHEPRYTPFAPRGKTDYHYAYVDKLVLKFTTYSQNNEESAFVIDKGGGTIGRDTGNTVSVPSDLTLQKEGHAVIGYKNGSFFLKNQGVSHCAAIRIGTEPGLRDWPLELGATFSAGNSIFLVKELLNGDLILEITDGPLKGERRKVQRKGATIGRSPDNTLSMSDPELSRRHSRIEFDEGDGKYYVSDVGSTNGTYMQLVGPYDKVFHLALSDQIMVGRTGFSVNRFDYGISEERGRRKTMEDHTLVIHDLGIRALKRFGLAPQTFAAVFDGHGGEEASAYLSRHLHLNLKKALERTFGAVPFDQGLGLDEVDMLVKEAVLKAFVKTDEDFLNKGDLDAGSTATTVLIMGRRIYSCNVGDSRTIISRNHALVLTSSDHKPSREDEARRIREAGGFIFQNRVMGELAVSRAFGDRELKKCMQDIMAPEELHQMALRDAKNNGDGEVVKDYSQPLVIARPEILVAELTEKDDFVLLACDGLFDVFSNPEVVRFVLEEMRAHHDAQRACENLSYTAIHQRIAHDNVSIVLLVTNKWW